MNPAVAPAAERYVSLERLIAELFEALGAYEGVTREIVADFVETAAERGWLTGLHVDPEGGDRRFSIEALELLVPAFQLWLMGADYDLVARVAADPDPIIAIMLDLHLTCRGAGGESGEKGEGDGGA